MTKGYNRVVILIFSCLITLFCGIIYAWTVFSVPLGELHGWTQQEMAVCFTINLSIGPIPMIVGYKLQRLKGCRLAILVGGLMVGVGMIGAGFSNSLPAMYMTFGLLVGAGVPMCYSSVMANAAGFFPDKKGFAMGCVLGAMGFGGLVISQIAIRLMLIPGVNVMHTFTIIGAIEIAVILLGMLFIKNSPEGYWPGHKQKPAAIGAGPGLEAASGRDINWKRMLRTPSYYPLILLFVAGVYTGVTMISSSSPIGISMYGLTATAASALVGILSVCSAAGRITGGMLYDRFGFRRCLLAIYVATACSLGLLLASRAAVSFSAAFMVIGYSYGFAIVIFPAKISDLFGHKFFTSNYAITFGAFSVSALIAPQFSAWMREQSGGDYTVVFAVSACVCVVGILLMHTVGRERPLPAGKELETGVSA